MREGKYAKILAKSTRAIFHTRDIWRNYLPKLKGRCPDYAHARALSVFSSKDNRTVILTRQDFLPDRTVDRDLLFIFSSKNFRLSKKSFVLYKNLARGSKTYCDFIASWAASRPENLVPLALKTYFLIWNSCQRSGCSKSSNICLICSRSSLKRWKDRNKNAISIIANFSQKLYYDFMELVFLNM